MTRETIIAKLKKIAALAERGVGGERENAERLLERLLAKHNLSIDDVREVEAPPKKYHFRYNSRLEKELLFQCVRRATRKGTVHYWKVGNRCELVFELRYFEYLELKALYEHFRPLLRKELKRLVTAFCMKHDLHSSTEPEDGEQESQLSPEEIEAIVGLMYGLQKSNYVSPRSSLPAIAGGTNA